MRIRFNHIIFCFVLLVSTGISAQTTSDTIVESKIFVEHADSTIVDNTGEDILRFFIGNVRMYHDSVYMFCDSSILKGNTLTAIGNVTFVQSDTITMFADSLVYFGDRSTAYLYDNVTIENGTQQLFTEALVYNTEQKVATYQDTALLKNNTATLQSKQGVYDINLKKVTFYDQVIVLDEDLRIRTDSLELLTEENRMLFVYPTRIEQKERRIYCESGFYSLDDGQALFTGNAQFIENDKTATADEIHYAAQDSSVLLIGNAYYQSGEKIATADRIDYSDKTQTTTLKGNANFKDGDSQSQGDTLIYNQETESIGVRGRGTISDPPTILDADWVDFDDATGKGLAKGDVVWKDTSANTTIYGEYLYYNKKANSIKAEGGSSRPYMMKIMDEDTTYLAADTLFSYEVVSQDTVTYLLDSVRFFAAYQNVNILKTDLKSNCDSLIYNEKDSLFQLYLDPVVWSDTTQFSGDSIFMYLKDSDISKIEIRQKSFIINKLEPEVFNQIRGRDVDVFFEEGKIDYMDVTGSAESLYFMQNDSSEYIGVNKTLCSHMRFLFEEDEMKDIKFYSQPESVLTPIKDINPVSQRLDRFNWQIENAPLDLQSIILWKTEEEELPDTSRLDSTSVKLDSSEMQIDTTKAEKANKLLEKQ